SVKRNMMSASDSHQTTTGFAFSPMLVTARANITEKTTICRTSPSAIALIIDAGARCVTNSPNVCGFAGTSVAAASGLGGGNTTPTPGFVRLTAASPITNANVVTTSK